MVKLFYSAGSCSTSCHISLEESGLEYQAVGIDWEREDDPNISYVNRLNPLGTLPVAILNGGTILRQNLAIHSYIGDLVPERKLLPRPGTTERAEAMNWLSFVAADLQKAFSPLFSLEAMINEPEVQNKLRHFFIHHIRNYLAFLERELAGKDYLMGGQFTVADSYCFVVAGWAEGMKISLAEYPNLSRYLDRVRQRPAVQRVLKEEGLLDRAA